LNWSKQTGISEEAALNYLAKHDYNINNALRETLINPQALRQLIKHQNRFEEKIETLAFIGSLTE